MAKYSATSSQRLASCHKDLQAVFNTVIINFDCSILCGHRTEVAQMEAYNGGKSQLKWPQSKHNKTPSLAVDVAPYPIDWKDLARFRYFAGYVTGIADRLYADGTITHRLRWGGDWDVDTQLKDNGFNDLPHFELVP